MRERSGDGFQGELDGFMKGHQVHLVERHVHDAGKVAFDHHVAADQFAHRISHGRVPAKRHQQIDIAVNEWLQRIAPEPTA